MAGVSGVTNSFNSNDQLATDVYDNNGSTRTNGSNIFFYDVENHLTNATVSGTNIVIVYDGDGNRVKEIVGTTTNFFLVDNRNPSGYTQVLEEKTGTTLTKTYAYGLDLISQRQSSTTSFCGYDGNGNTRFLTTTNGTISDTYTYDAFGILVTSTGTTANFYRYTGEQYDPNLGFYYLRARYLNPNTGRFWTRDSFDGTTADPTSLHKYLYVADNPVNATDPSGNDLLAANLGTKIHTLIGQDFIDKFEPFGISGSSVATALNKYGININAITALFPDLVDINPANKEVYEIKRIDSFVLGEAQLQGYLQVFNYFDPAKGWKPGSTYTPPVEITIDPLTAAIVSPPVGGVILYKIFSVKQFAKRRAVNVAVSESADVEDSVGISTLTSVLGGF